MSKVDDENHELCVKIIATGKQILKESHRNYRFIAEGMLPIIESSERFCKACGQNIPLIDYNFCPFCGASLEGEGHEKE